MQENEQNLGDELMRQLEFIDKSNIQITQNRAVINTLSQELIQLNNSLNSVSEGIKELEFSKNFILAMLQVRNRLDMMRDGIQNLKEDLSKVHDYMLSLTTHKVSPNLIPPTDLREILEDVKTKLIANPKLTLPVHENADIWSYYQFLKIDAFVHQDMIIIILILPLIDKDLEFDLFKANSLPLLHPELRKIFTYELDNPYIALCHDGNYFTLPYSEDILTCQISAGHFCNLNTPLYPTTRTTECIYHLLVDDKENIQKYCMISIQEYERDSAINLQGNIWALSVREPTKLHVSCLVHTYEIKVSTSFQLIELDNGCQAYSPNIMLPSGNQMSGKMNNSLIQQRFFNYDIEYSSIPNFFLMKTFNITKLTKDQINKLSIELPEIQKIRIEKVTATLKKINTSYPIVFPLYGYILVTVGGTILVVTLIGILYYRKTKSHKTKHQASRFQKEDIEIIEKKPMSVRTLDNIEINQSHEEQKVTPMLLRTTLEKELRVDFSSYEKYKRKKHVTNSAL